MTGQVSQDLMHPIVALLGEQGHVDARAAVAHFSFSREDSFIGLVEPGGPPVPLVSFLPLPGNGGEVLDAVAGIDDSGARLVVRFEQAFPDTVARLRGIESGIGPTPVLSWLLGLCSLALDLDEDDVRRALGGTDMVMKADVVVIEEGDDHVLDGRRLLRSAMSYRLAGAPRHAVAASVFVSLGEFAGDAVRRLVRSWPAAEVVACGGDLFAANVLLREQTRRSLAGLRLPVLFPSPAG